MNRIVNSFPILRWTFLFTGWSDFKSDCCKRVCKSFLSSLHLQISWIRNFISFIISWWDIKWWRAKNHPIGKMKKVYSSQLNRDSNAVYSDPIQQSSKNLVWKLGGLLSNYWMVQFWIWKKLYGRNDRLYSSNMVKVLKNASIGVISKNDPWLFSFESTFLAE